MTQRLFFDRLEFYITNVCNHTCSNCNRYNNYRFSGHWRWKDAEPVLREWQKKIEIRHPVILGGEPLLNPDIVEWINGLAKLWPEHSGVQVQSNGTMIDRIPGLYEALDARSGNWIGISIHSQADVEDISVKIKNFLKHPVIATQNKDDPIGSDYQFTDANKNYAHAWMSDKFVTTNIIERPDGRLTLYNSDPEKAHANCTFVKFKNYHMIRGKIYKCGPTALMPEFDDQHHFDISDDDRVIMRGYQPLTLENVDQQGEEFMHNIDKTVAQCKFCPESYDYKPITFSDRKKPWRRSEPNYDFDN